MANHRAESGKLLFLRMISIVEIFRPKIRIPDQNASVLLEHSELWRIGFHLFNA